MLSPYRNLLAVFASFHFGCVGALSIGYGRTVGPSYGRTVFIPSAKSSIARVLVFRAIIINIVIWLAVLVRLKISLNGFGWFGLLEVQRDPKDTYSTPRWWLLTGTIKRVEYVYRNIDLKRWKCYLRPCHSSQVELYGRLALCDVHVSF